MIRRKNSRPSPPNSGVRLSDQAYQRLSYAIIEGEIPAGSRLVELELSRKFKVGRTPIHDALVRLAADGLVKSVPNAGFLVRSFTFEDLEVTQEIRCELESLAIRIACRKGFSASRLVDLEQQCEMMAQGIAEGQPRAVAQSVFRFHRLLIGLAENRQLEVSVRGSHLQFFTWSRSVSADLYLKVSQGLTEEHRILVELLRQRNAQKAEEQLRKFMAEGLRRIEEMRRQPNAEELLRNVRSLGEFSSNPDPLESL